MNEVQRSAIEAAIGAAFAKGFDCANESASDVDYVFQVKSSSINELAATIPGFCGSPPLNACKVIELDFKNDEVILKMEPGYRLGNVRYALVEIEGGE